VFGSKTFFSAFKTAHTLSINLCTPVRTAIKTSGAAHQNVDTKQVQQLEKRTACGGNMPVSSPRRRAAGLRAKALMVVGHVHGQLTKHGKNGEM